jgi:hypothetical protein
MNADIRGSDINHTDHFYLLLVVCFFIQIRVIRVNPRLNPQAVVV